MPTAQELVSQELADVWAKTAQKYAGYFYGFETTAGQHGTADDKKVFVSDVPWTEPLVFEDDCDFCKITTDERVRERIAGFQNAIDIEILRGKTTHYNRWVKSEDPRVPQPGEYSSAANRRTFIELFQDVPTERRPFGWRKRALNMIELPPHLQRRLCIEWNHLLRDWLEAHSEAFYYDFEAHQVKIRVPEQRLAADPDEDQALRELRDEDRAYAATPFGGEDAEIELLGF